MEDQALQVLYQLLPGFLVCWVFYGLTAHPKPSQFERVVQALIFSMIVKVVVARVRTASLWLGQHFHSFGPWTGDGENAASLAAAIAIGLLVARFANDNSIHRWLSGWGAYESIRKHIRWLPRWQFTKRTSMPSEWYSAFHRFELDVVLHMTNGRRLRGYPDEWSDSPDKGHITLYKPSWVLDDNTEAPLLTVERIMVRDRCGDGRIHQEIYGWNGPRARATGTISLGQPLQQERAKWPRRSHASRTRRATRGTDHRARILRAGE